MIRLYVPADAPKLAAIHNRVYPDEHYSVLGFNEYVEGIRSLGGFFWVITNPVPAGYGSIAPVPGLQGISELAGCIAPEQQRKGLGSRLLAGMLDGLRGSDIQQLSFSVDRLDSPAALFLRGHNFFVEHEEWILRLDEMAKLPQRSCPGEIKLQTYSRKTAVSLFCKLYEESFTGLPWNQPFAQIEVADTLDNADDILFLMQENRAVGIAWTKLDSEGTGIVEPLGIVPAFQNRGYGRCLLISAVHILAKRGAKRIEIGAWRRNERAVELYRSLDFQHIKTITYLAYNL